MSIMDKVFSYIPRTEVIARRIYKSNAIDQRKIKRIKKRIIHPGQKENTENKPNISLDELKKIINDVVYDGDILIAHTSMDGMDRVDSEASEVLDLLISSVGEKGTLVLPTFPKYKKKEENLPKYDYNHFIAWTGIIPNLFIRERNAITSHIPLNTLSALGYQAHEMFLKENRAEYTYGRHTAWEYCKDHHAKVMFIGVRPFHSISEAHIAEDLLGENYPIKGWHEKKKFMVGTDKSYNEVEYYIRKPEWSKYVAEHYFERKILEKGAIRDISVPGLYIYVIDDLFDFVEYMINRIERKDLIGNNNIPRKYWKKS